MVKISEWESLDWGVYKGKTQLVVFQKGKDGEMKPRFVKVENKARELVTIPFTISFDSKDAAIDALQALIVKLRPPKEEGNPFE